MPTDPNDPYGRGTDRPTEGEPWIAAAAVVAWLVLFALFVTVAQVAHHHALLAMYGLVCDLMAPHYEAAPEIGAQGEVIIGKVAE